MRESPPQFRLFLRVFAILFIAFALCAFLVGRRAEGLVVLGALLAFSLVVLGLIVTSTHIYLRFLTRGLAHRTVSTGLFETVVEGELDGRAYRIEPGRVDVFVPSTTQTTLGRRELEEIASGIVSRRTGTFAVNPEYREAAATLLASGKVTVLYLDHYRARFEGFQRGEAAAVVRALIRLASPGFVLSLHAGTGVCPYCKEPADEEAVSCEKCGARHHASCFTEHGGCAIFGCERAPLGRRTREKA